MKLVHNIKASVKNYRKAYQQKKRWLNDLKYIQKVTSEYDFSIPTLSETEKQSITAYWKPYGFEFSHDWHRFLYSVTGRKDVSFLPEPVFQQKIKNHFNDYTFGAVWSDKAYTDFFIRDAKVVRSVVRNVNGRFLDEAFNVITMAEASKIMQNFDALVIKPSTLTDTGKGVKLLHKPYDLEGLAKEYKKNFVIQIPLKQHSELAKLNESSVNTIRVNSVLLGTEAHVMSAFIKVGQTGQFADNNGHERFFIGINEDGCFNSYAIDHDLKKYDQIPSGYQFAGQKVPSYDKVCAAIERAHKNIPHFGFAFWDVCVDETGEPVIVEVNLRYPDTVIAQATGNPFFGKYTDQVLASFFKNMTK